ncbi:lysozyme inhibitor LprI family protein [Dyella sp.]|uniref:lysozyme inhibitor LprI family protein n=1 Tax=Dyella sp. TaxID=1869338 RepID=UPI002ED24537
MASGVCAASFDCAKAKSDTEKLICKDAETSALDSKLQQAYKTAQAATDAAGKKVLVDEQRHWITYVRDLCTDQACLQQAYTARIALLARNEKYIIDKSSCETLAGGTQCVNVVTYRDPSIRIHSFNQSLGQAKQAGKIIGCSQLINLPVGTAGSNNSFGGICTLQDGTQRKVVEICDDDMFGHFEIKPIDLQETSEKNLIGFTHENCFGG